MKNASERLFTDPAGANDYSPDGNLLASDQTPPSLARWRALFESTLAWIEREIGRFLLGPDSYPGRDLARLKPLAEVALACDLGLHTWQTADGAWPQRQAARLRKLLEALREDVGEGARLAVLFHGDPKPAGIPLSALGVLANSLGAWGALPRWPAAERPTAAETQPPWVFTFDLEAVARRLGFPRDMNPSRQAQVAPPAHPALPGSAAYAAAHMVFFRTDFGRKPSGLGDVERAWLRAWTPIWQRQFLDAGDLDLLGEMTILNRCLGVPHDGVDVPSALQRGQESDGAIAAPREADGGDAAWNEAAGSWFRRRYHTTLVVNMAAALSADRVS